MANDLLQERIQHLGILWLTCPADDWNVMFHRKLVSEEVPVLDPWIYHKGDGKKKKKKKDQKPLSRLSGTQSMCWVFLEKTSKREAASCQSGMKGDEEARPWKREGKDDREEIHGSAALIFQLWTHY